MADAKITALVELATTPDNADILAIVDDVAGSPITKKITIANLLGSVKEVSEEGLVLGMNFNSENITGSAGSETVLDSSTYNNHGTNNGATHDPDGGFNGGGAFSFDGVDDTIPTSLTDNSVFTDSNGFTLSAWIKTVSRGEGSSNNYGRIFDKSDGSINQNGFSLYMGDDGVSVRFRINEGATTGSGSNDFSVGNWANVLVVINSSSQITYYINGEISGTANQQLDDISNITSSAGVAIGNRSGATDRTFDGLIDSPKIYNRALSADEIKAQYLQRAEVGDSFVSQSDVFVDSSGNIGIGEVSPGARLDIKGSTNDGTTNVLQWKDSDSAVLGVITTNGNVGIGTTNPSEKLEVAGAITQSELSLDPADPEEGSNVKWQSDGTGSGDDGDIMMKITAGGVTKVTTLVDFSAL